MSVPSPSLVPPTLSIYQAWFKGVTFGGIAPGTNYQLVDISGIDGIPTSGGDSQRSLDLGALAGADVGGSRDITLSVVLSVPVASRGVSDLTAARSALAASRQALAGAVGVPQYASESPFYYQAENGLYCCMARPEKFAFTLDSNMVQAVGGIATILMRATDPRLYAAPSLSQIVGSPGVPGGFTFPLTFPATPSAGGGSSTITAVNAGQVEMRPVIVFTGPCTNPAIQNLSQNGSPTIAFNIVLNTGDTLTVDTDLETAVLVLAGTTQGQSRRNTLTINSTWWNLPPGTSTLNFTTGDAGPVAGTCTVNYASAYPGL